MSEEFVGGGDGRRTGRAVPPEAEFVFGVNAVGGSSGDWKNNAVEFIKGLAEMSVEFGRGCRDVVKQSVLARDSYLVKKFGGPCEEVCAKLRFLNEYLPEDRDPVHSWTVILFVSFVAIAVTTDSFIACYLQLVLLLGSDLQKWSCDGKCQAIFLCYIVLIVNIGHDTTTPLVKRLYIHPPNASRILLPDGRHLAYKEQGVPADRARFSVITAHPFLSSRLAGIPGLKASIMQEFGIRLISYDLPGFGESDPHPNRNLESSALDMLQLSYAVGVTDKFWVLGYSGGSMHAWAALRYIPDRVAGAVMLAPMVNPYEPSMTKKERSRIWENWTARRKFQYFLARKFPRCLAYLYRQSFLSGSHGPIEKWLSLSLGTRDRALIKDPMFEEFWQRDVEESVRQRNVKPFVEEAVLQVSHWGFSLSDLKIQKKRPGKGILLLVKSILGKAEKELTAFLGPIHIWQGMDDKVVPPSMTDFVQRVLPGAMVHKLLYDGHFSFLYFCDECHRQMLETLFGDPQGPLAAEVDQAPPPEVEAEENEEEEEEAAAEEEEAARDSAVEMQSPPGCSTE